MAPSVLEFRLERSRLDLSARSGRTSSFSTLGAISLVWLQVVLAVVCFLVIVEQFRLLDKMARWHPAFEGLYFLSDLLCTLLPSSKMVLPVIFLSLVLLHMIYRHVISKNIMVAKQHSQGQGGDSFKTRFSGASLCQPGSPEPEGTISQGLEDLSNLEEPSPPPPSLFHPLSSTPTMSNPLKTRDEVTINHEFALVDGDNNSGCDISVLSLGSPPSSPRGEAFPSAPRQYSPPPSSTLSLFSPKRPLLRPSRLTSSWVAGGYWTSPAQQQSPGKCLALAGAFINKADEQHLSSTSLLWWQQQRGRPVASSSINTRVSRSFAWRPRSFMGLGPATSPPLPLPIC